MVRTAVQEHFGDVVDRAVSSTYSLRPPSGYQGCVRFYVLRPSASVDVRLTNPSTSRFGGIPQYVVANINGGGFSLTVKTDRGATVGTIAANSIGEVFCLDASGLDGVWAMTTQSVTEGSLVEPPDLVAYTVNIGSTQNFHLRNWVDENTDYDGVSPAYVRCNVTGVIGSDDVSDYAFDTGSWPAGCKVTLAVSLGSFISGKGGDGGRGGDVTGLLAQNGVDGGPALICGVDTTLINHGTIQGGGGGGAATAKSGSYGGAGGGGGGGRPGGNGGSPGTGGSSAAQTQSAGGPGSLISGGVGGYIVAGFPGIRGGNGGAPGSDGDTTSTTASLVGAAGEAISVATGFTLTKTVAGTILGAEVVV